MTTDRGTEAVRGSVETLPTPPLMIQGAADMCDPPLESDGQDVTSPAAIVVRCSMESDTFLESDTFRPARRQLR
jgi:hypothetical protein